MITKSKQQQYVEKLMEFYSKEVVEEMSDQTIQRLAEDREPDLVRTEVGYVIELFYLPSLDAPESAIVQIMNGKVILDQIETTVEDAYDTWLHATIHSEKYAVALV